MKVSDAVALWLRDHCITHVYTVSGGANLHIIHSLAKTEGIEYVPMQTESGAGFAADSHTRINGGGVALVTSGPGATNLVTAIGASWYDSVPTIYITGNQTRERLKPYGRQYGFQAMPFPQIVAPITKFAQTIMDANYMLMWLDEAWKCANQHRRGPAVVDIPDDIARSEI